MEFKVEKKEADILLHIAGRVDSNTSRDLEKAVNGVFEENPKRILFDLEKMDYISSAGLRVLLSAQKKANERKLEMELIHVKDIAKEVFEITGFSGIFKIS